MREGLLLDGHVHVHPGYDEGTFLAAAHANLSRQGDGFPALLLAEMAGANVFARWRSGRAPWPVEPTEEAASLVLGGRLLVVAGRQIVTREGVEVLAQATAETWADGQPLDDTLRQVLDAGALAVLPWGAGKWLGARGRLVAQAARRFPVLIGDSALRPVGWPAPALFRHHVVLAGTDPLRMPAEQHRVGSYGFPLQGSFDLRRPAARIRAVLERTTRSPRPFGRRVGLVRFARQQLGLRWSR